MCPSLSQNESKQSTYWKDLVEYIFNNKNDFKDMINKRLWCNLYYNDHPFWYLNCTFKKVCCHLRNTTNYNINLLF